MRGRGYEQEMSREPPSPSRTEGTTTQSREEEMTDWGGVGWGGGNRALLWEELGGAQTSWAGPPGYLCSISNQGEVCEWPLHAGMSPEWAPRPPGF